VIDGNRVLHVVRFPRHINDVWRALTAEAELTQWFMATDFVPEVGYRYRIDAHPAFGFIDGDVLEVDAPRLLRCRWVINGVATTVTLRLQPDGADTVVRLEHEAPIQARALNGSLR
jgi:uncharacterized protein YndB with AHSA1/START domain